MKRTWIFDLASALTLVALNIGALFLLASPFDEPKFQPQDAPEWLVLIYLTPTIVTSWLHIRLCLTNVKAVMVHILAAFVWMYLHTTGLRIVTTWLKGPSWYGYHYEDRLFPNGWLDGLEAWGWALLLAFTYGLACYTADSVSSKRQELTSQKMESEVGNIHPCPQCGRLLSRASIICPHCEHRFFRQ